MIYIRKTAVLCTLISLTVLLPACEIYNPSFADFAAEGTSPEMKKGFFCYDFVFPSILGVEELSYFILVSQEGGNDELNLDAGWMTGASEFEDANGRKYKRISSGANPPKVPYGYYKMVLCIRNPNSSLTREMFFWISPGKETNVSQEFYEADFITN
ncbi:MAG: hypothetical protein LBC77_08640 [Spirochaetaceae bacterium]|jgi:hypothetical protein|nr:hypothetical protein [Spirochaetaceae bacterium]